MTAIPAPGRDGRTRSPGRTPGAAGARQPHAWGIGRHLHGLRAPGAAGQRLHALSMAAMCGLSGRETMQEARRVARVVDGWRVHFNSLGVSAEATALPAT